MQIFRPYISSIFEHRRCPKKSRDRSRSTILSPFPIFASSRINYELRSAAGNSFRYRRPLYVVFNNFARAVCSLKLAYNYRYLLPRSVRRRFAHWTSTDRKFRDAPVASAFLRCRLFFGGGKGCCMCGRQCHTLVSGMVHILHRSRIGLLHRRRSSNFRRLGMIRLNMDLRLEQNV